MENGKYLALKYFNFMVHILRDYWTFGKFIYLNDIYLVKRHLRRCFTILLMRRRCI